MTQALKRSDRTTPSTLARLRAFAVLAFALPTWHIATAASVSEQKLKAAFIYNFTKFVEWPPERFDGTTAPVVIGLLADDALQAEIAAIVANRHINGRTFVIRPIVSASDLQAAHLVFVSAEQQSRFDALRGAAPPAAVLTIGDGENCRSHGGGICFLQRGEKLRFEINVDAVERSQIKISAQLQKLAVAVNRGH